MGTAVVGAWVGIVVVDVWPIGVRLDTVVVGVRLGTAVLVRLGTEVVLVQLGATIVGVWEATAATGNVRLGKVLDAQLGTVAADILVGSKCLDASSDSREEEG